MKLADYLSTNGITYDRFADVIGVANATTVRRYAVGERIPHPAIMAEIVRATGGDVQPNDFFAEAA